MEGLFIMITTIGNSDFENIKNMLLILHNCSGLNHFNIIRFIYYNTLHVVITCI